jgi:murein DD-endopeptidase MepM/ murein hydrolase activator NlpD
MALNPFKDSNLADLQQSINEFASKHFGLTVEKTSELAGRIHSKGKERLTVMFIPHSEKRITNFHISIYAISIIIAIVAITIPITSIMIINHSSTTKQVSKLKMHGKMSKEQIKKYRTEINSLYDVFQTNKKELKKFYSLLPDNNSDTLWARGGVANPSPENTDDAGDSPPIEILNLQEIDHELKTSLKVIKKIKKFVQYRKNIINNTPSIWPVEGYIISRFGQRTSPYTFEKEYHLGIDIEGYPGTEIRATAPGTIRSVAWDQNRGLTISIKHKYGFETIYSHCQRSTVQEGQKVKKNEVIGYLGRTGKTTRYICFYQVRVGTEYVDPMPYLNRINK